VGNVGDGELRPPHTTQLPLSPGIKVKARQVGGSDERTLDSSRLAPGILWTGGSTDSNQETFGRTNI
jgi:hypothetical protein